MSILVLIGIGVLAGLTTVLFGFGGGFVTVPVIVWADAGLGQAAAHVAVATSSVVMVVNACAATAATDRAILRQLRGTPALLLLLAAGGAVGTVAARWAPGSVIQWAFVAYLAITIADLLLRPGFFRPRTTLRPGQGGNAAIPKAIPALLGAPIGAIAAFLGVGGSVMTVPMLRRSGRDMSTATSLANPLTLAIAVPAMAIFLMEKSPPRRFSGGLPLRLGRPRGCGSPHGRRASRHHHPAPTSAAHFRQLVLLELPVTAHPRHRGDGRRVTPAQLTGSPRPSEMGTRDAAASH